MCCPLGCIYFPSLALTSQACPTSASTASTTLGRSDGAGSVTISQFWNRPAPVRFADPTRARGPSLVWEIHTLRCASAGLGCLRYKFLTSTSLRARKALTMLRSAGLAFANRSGRAVSDHQGYRSTGGALGEPGQPPDTGETDRRRQRSGGIRSQEGLDLFRRSARRLSSDSFHCLRQYRQRAVRALQKRGPAKTLRLRVDGRRFGQAGEDTRRVRSGRLPA